MTRILLIRHASVEAIGKWLVGRNEGVHLSDRGQMEARCLAQRLASQQVDAIYSSPLERSQETARPVVESMDLPITTRTELSDVDFGDWTGKSFSDLNDVPEWHSFNTQRARARIPGGEAMLDVLRRMVLIIEELRDQHADQTIALFSHCDPIRAAITHYLGMNLDNMRRIVISPASISVLDIDLCGSRVVVLNSVGKDFAIAAD